VLLDPLHPTRSSVFDAIDEDSEAFVLEAKQRLAHWIMTEQEAITPTYGSLLPDT